MGDGKKAGGGGGGGKSGGGESDADEESSDSGSDTADEHECEVYPRDPSSLADSVVYESTPSINNPPSSSSSSSADSDLDKTLSNTKRVATNVFNTAKSFFKNRLESNKERQHLQLEQRALWRKLRTEEKKKRRELFLTARELKRREREEERYSLNANSLSIEDDDVAKATPVTPVTPKAENETAAVRPEPRPLQRKMTLLRKTRKLSSSYFGVRGAFSGKYRQPTPTPTPSPIEPEPIGRPEFNSKFEEGNKFQQQLEVVENDNITTIEAPRPPPNFAITTTTTPKSNTTNSNTTNSTPPNPIPRPPDDSQLSVSGLEARMEYHSARLNTLTKAKTLKLFGSPNPLKLDTNTPPQLINNYISSLKKRKILVPLNHVKLWSDDDPHPDDDDSEEEDHVGDDLFSTKPKAREKKKIKKPSGGGSWILRQTIPSFFDKVKDKDKDKDITHPEHMGIKLTTMLEDMLYNVIVKAVIGGILSGLSGLHGVNLAGIADIELSVDRQEQPQTPDDSNSQEFPPPPEYSYPQLYFVTEGLLSQMQIAAPLLKLFPLKLQRELLQNLILLLTVTVRDCLLGIRLNILGSSVKLDLAPINFKFRNFEAEIGNEVNEEVSERSEVK